jgi:hypothetical protein
MTVWPSFEMKPAKAASGSSKTLVAAAPLSGGVTMRADSLPWAPTA